MKPIFKSLSTRAEVDLIPYLTKYLAENKNVNMYIGCDSQNIKKITSYAIVIVLHNIGKGAHVVYAQERVPRITDRFTRLWKEVEWSVSTAEYLRKHGLGKVSFIDLDLNPDPKYKSNQVLRSALGYVESMGYVARVKPYATAASHVADILCK